VVIGVIGVIGERLHTTRVCYR